MKPYNLQKSKRLLNSCYLEHEWSSLGLRAASIILCQKLGVNTYDLVSWDFLEEVMMGLGFPNKFILLAMACVRSVMFSIYWKGS